MNERMKTTLVLLVLVVATGLAAYKQQVQRTRLVYADSLDMVAMTVDDEELDLRDMAVYVALQEKKVQQEALVYNPDKPESYWNAYTNQHFVRAVAENAVKDMAVHDEIFFRMAVEESLELDDAELLYLENEMTDFFMDVTEEQMAQLGVSDEDVRNGMHKIALANKCQSILAQMEGIAYEEYDYTGAAYEVLLSGHEVSIEKEVWSRIAVGNITVNYKKKTAASSDAVGTE